MNPLSNMTAFADAWWDCVLHSTWQSSLVVVAAFAVLWLRRRRSATFLYAVLVVALLKFLVPPIISLPVLEHPSAAPTVASVPDAINVAMPAEREAAAIVEETPAPEPAIAVAPRPEVTHETLSSPSPAPQPMPEMPQTASVYAETSGIPAAPANPASLETPVAAVTRHAPPAQTFRILDHWKAVLALLHLTGIVVLGLLMANSYLHLRRLLRAAQPAELELSNLANEVAERLGLRRRVSVLLTAVPCAPMAAGLFKRRILLPEALAGLRPDELRAILAHELAHHRRLDLVVVWMEHLVTLLWWFNPLVWMLIRALHRTREDCCDDMVLSLGLAGDSEYCDTLLRAAKRLHRPLAPRLIFGCASRLHPMAQRLTRIMDTAIRRRAALTAWGTAGVMLMGLVLLPTFLPVAADANDARTGTDETQTSTDAARTAESPAAAPTATVSAKAEPGKEWYDTGIVMAKGVTFALTAEGSVSWDRNLPRVTPVGAGRTPNASCGRPEEFPMPDAPCGGLLGRIGEGQPFFIGEHTTVTGDGGYLFLTVNDRLNEFGDNDGSFAVNVTLAATVSMDELNRDLLAYYPFDGDTADHSGNGHDGTLHGKMTFAEGAVGQGLSFTGVDDYVDIPAVPDEVLGSRPRFVGLWLFPRAIGEEGLFFVAMGPLDPAKDARSYSFRLIAEHSGRLEVNISFDRLHSRIDVIKDRWNYVFAYWDGNHYSAGKICEGVFEEEKFTTSVGRSPASNLQQGQFRIGHVSFKETGSQGIVDEFRLYKRVLSREEILAIYDQGNPSAKFGALPKAVPSNPAITETKLTEGATSDPAAKVDEEIAAHYANADAEIQDYIRWTAKNFSRGNLWYSHDAFAQLAPEDREKKIAQIVEALNAEYGRHLCPALAEAGALKDARLLPGLIKAASYHRDDSDYDCRPKWMAVSALGRQDDISAVPTLIPLVDHGNTNTRMWARASLVRLTGQNFKDDKQAWGTWWNNSGHEPKIDLTQLKPWVMPGQAQAATPPPAAPPSRPLQPATVPPESQAVVDALPGELVFKGSYFHRSRGSDLSAPSVVWIKKTSEGEVIAASYLPAFNDTSVAHLSPNSGFRRYEGHYQGRDGGAPSARYMDLTHGAVTIAYEGGEKNGTRETLTVPPKAIFMPNSRPDSYTAHMGIAAFQGTLGLPAQPVELLCYDWDNTGKGMASYTIRTDNMGKEEVTVPAGRFSATHYIENQLTSGDTWYKKRAGHTTDYWVLDNGVIVRILRHREPYELQLSSVETPAELPGFLGKAEVKAAGTLKVLSAVYGAGDSWIDLTEVLNQRIQNDTLEVLVSNELGGDPIYGSPKQLNVHYRVGDKTYVTTVDELETLRLPEPPKQQSSSTGMGTQSSQGGAAATRMAQASAGIPAELQSQPASNTDDMVVLNREKMAQEMASLNYADVVTTLNPWMVKDNEGKYIGIASDNFASVPLFGAIGLQNGDVVNTINGIKVDSDQKLAEVFEKFANASNFRLGVTRNGDPVTLSFRLE